MQTEIIDRKVIDQTIREELLNPQASFIVQAPAGAGKTEILIQRILSLLCVIDKPENILAITFTRKAAEEMQARVINALKLAEQPEPTLAHQKTSWRLAKKVLERDKLKAWSLLNNPSRLKISTIDSFSAGLSQALPLASQVGALPQIAENAQPLYQQAAENLIDSIADADPYAELISGLLAFKDNQVTSVIELLSQMLAKRLQWMSVFQYHLENYHSDKLLQSFNNILLLRLKRLYQLIPQDILAELPPLLNQASVQLKEKGDNSKPHLLMQNNLSQISAPEIKDLPVWLAISQLLLKKNSDELLKQFNVTQGFPPKDKAKDEQQAQQFISNKKNITQIAKDLSAQPEIGELLYEISLFSNDQSQTQHEELYSVLRLLPVAVAHLKLVFSQQNQIDYAELTIAAIEALGRAENPSDLALALDYRIEHILVDEFQDTSTPQIQLLKLLTNEWQTDSQKTLFLVGDPMQSIYRFRDANVSLFMQAKAQGIGQVKLNFRRLKVNFRSQQNIVDWINQKFSKIMPQKDYLDYSAVSYASSTAFNANTEQAQVKCLFSLDQPQADIQAENICNIIQQHINKNQQLIANQQPPKSLAVLVRSRKHLQEIVALLNQQSILYEAIDIDPLQNKMHVRDLINLALALCDNYDELSWAAVMRSAYFCLSLDDIYKVLVDTDETLPFPQRISQHCDQLSENAQERCAKILPVLQSTIAFKGEKPFKKWLKGCCDALGIFYQLDVDSEIEELQICLDKLAELNQAGELNDRQAIDQAIGQLYAQPARQNPNLIYLMTIHKSKGLEFDTVILPRLDATTRASDKPLVNWTELFDQQGNPQQLIALLNQTGEDLPTSYQYITYVEKQKAKYELQRLFYVAVTRAREQLFLLANIKSSDKQDYAAPAKSSILAMLWPHIQTEFELIADSNQPQQPNDLLQTELFTSRYIKRINLDRIAQLSPADYAAPQLLIEQPVVEAAQPVKSFIEDEQSIVIGNLLHKQLEWISYRYDEKFTLPNNWQEITFHQLKTELGFYSHQQLQQATEQVITAIKNTLQDSMGQFILTGLKQANSELKLHKKISEDYFISRIIDRTFVVDGKRWIIDYKSSQPQADELLRDFYQREKLQYLAQLQEYAQLISQIDKTPITAGLYFPMIPGFQLVIE